MSCSWPTNTNRTPADVLYKCSLSFLVASGGLRLALWRSDWLAQAHHQSDCTTTAPPPRQPTQPCTPCTRLLHARGVLPYTLLYTSVQTSTDLPYTSVQTTDRPAVHRLGPVRYPWYTDWDRYTTVRTTRGTPTKTDQSVQFWLNLAKTLLNPYLTLPYTTDSHAAVHCTSASASVQNGQLLAVRA